MNKRKRLPELGSLSLLYGRTPAATLSRRNAGACVPVLIDLRIYRDRTGFGDVADGLVIFVAHADADVDYLGFTGGCWGYCNGRAFAAERGGVRPIAAFSNAFPPSVGGIQSLAIVSFSSQNKFSSHSMTFF